MPSTAAGAHLGGLIFPGARLLASALDRNTSDIGRTAPAPAVARGLDLLGRNTDAAVGHGAWLALSAALDRAVATVERALGTPPVVYLTGGDAEALQGWLETRVELRADLVLEGLGVVRQTRKQALMRNLFLVLVLVNLAFAAWSAWFAPAQPRRRRADDGLPALTLVSEVPADLRSSGVVVGAAPEASGRTLPSPSQRRARRRPRTPSPMPTAAAATRRRPRAEPSVTQAAARCTSVGPFRELSQAATAAAALRTAGYQPMQRVVEGDIWSGYWVYIPAIPTEQEANETLAKVREGVARRVSRTPMSFATATAAISSRSACSARSAASAGCATRCARSVSSRKSSIARAARRCIGSMSRSRPSRRSTSTRCSRRAASSGSSSAPARRRASDFSLDRGFFSERVATMRPLGYGFAAFLADLSRSKT